MSDLKQQAADTFETVEAELIELSRWMYEHPETAYEEFESSRRLSETLAEHGFEVTYPAYGIDTAFEATAGTSGPRVVICAEYDALPGVGHACGHNIIATSSLGAGIALAGLVEELGIRLTVLGTPAEEGGGGKIDLLEAGAFDGAAASMLIHPTHRERGDLADPRLLAAQGLTVEYHGKEAHAAAAPYAGVNALDAFVSAYNAVSALRQQFREGDRVHGVIDEGGLAPNVVPAYAKSRWIVRALTKERFEELREKVIACFHAAATATGCTVEITPEGEPYVDLISDPVLVELFVANSETLGRPMPTHAEVGVPVFASTDMGNVSHAVPSIHPSVAIDTDAVNHQAEFAAATITESGNKALRDGALAMAHTIIDMAVEKVWTRLAEPTHDRTSTPPSDSSSG